MATKKKKKLPPTPAEAVLLEFIKDINDTGGITVGSDGSEGLVADPDWYDLAQTYRKACAAMEVEPKVADLEDDEAGDDLCDMCNTSGVTSSRTTYCGKTIGNECGCSEDNEDGVCNDDDCEDCHDDE